MGLVNRFIDAESVGNWWAADSLVAWSACVRDRATDSLMVTTAFQVQAAGPIGDSALVRVIYDMAGRVWLAPPPIAGPQRTRFTGGAWSDTVIYRVFADSTGGGASADGLWELPPEPRGSVATVGIRQAF